MALNRTSFKRHTGVYPEVFYEMHSALLEWEAAKKKPGRPPVLALNVQLVVTLEFWREYRTSFHLGQEWGVYETTAQRTLERVEDALLGSGKFSLPGKRALKSEKQVWNAVLVDVSEVACEQPKKSSGRGTAARRSGTP